MQEHLVELLTLNSISGIGIRLYSRLLHFFDNIANIAQAKQDELIQVRGIGKETAKDIYNAFKEKRGERELSLALKDKIGIIPYYSDEYPLLLRNTYDYPLVLYTKGKFKPKDINAISIIGSRGCSYYGKKHAKRFAFQLSQMGITIVSGLARGIDTYAHRGALDGGGRTIAVLGSGLFCIYPPENKKLFEEIACRGVCISELPLNTPPESRNFPRRNRIISGLSQGILVVEASLYSGAMITVQFALDQGRDVFAIPGNIDWKESCGCNLLIKKGAKLVDNVYDILEELPFLHYKEVSEKKEPQRETTFTHTEKTIYDYIRDNPIHIDELIRKSEMDVREINRIVMKLELEGLIKRIPGNFYIRIFY